MTLNSFLTILTLTSFRVFAGTVYTVDEVAAHDTSKDCYMIFENKVYDLSDYLQEHDQLYYDISSWCGKDMTQDFQTKDERGEDHKARAYSLLEDYYIGELNSTVAQSDGGNANTSNAPYNFVFPIGLTIIFYLSVRFFVDTKKVISLSTFKGIQNVLLLFALIPSAAFGIILAVGCIIPPLRKLSSVLLYWHVEGSLVFTTLILLHLIERIKQLLIQIMAMFHIQKVI